jgi:hypothetical protein
MSNQPPHQNTPSGTPPPPPPGTGYTYYPEQQGSQAGYVPPAGYPQQGAGYVPPVGYGQPVYPGVGYVQQPDSRRGLAISGFILGIISIFLWILFNGVGALLDVIVAILGITLSSLGMRSTTLRGLAIAGLVLSIIGAVIVVIIIIIAIIYARSWYYYGY